MAFQSWTLKCLLFPRHTHFCYKWNGDWGEVEMVFLNTYVCKVLSWELVIKYIKKKLIPASAKMNIFLAENGMQTIWQTNFQ